VPRNPKTWTSTEFKPPPPHWSGHGSSIHEPTCVIRKSRTPSFHKILGVDLRFNGSYRPITVDLWTGVRVLVLQARGHIPPFFFKENNSKISENARTLSFCREATRFFNYILVPEFYKNNLKLFQNYIFVPVILHLGPYIIFYNYD
jgi:hypothetical protein